MENTEEKLKYAQDLIKTSSANVRSGFNQFVNGTGYPQRGYYGDKNQWWEECQGYDYAQKMAILNGISFTKVFKCENDNNHCHPFSYGGNFVCNSCGRNNLKKEWWEIKVEKDGSSYCCHGLDFVNLQESNNYAFGDTFEESINNYEKLMLLKNV